MASRGMDESITITEESGSSMLYESMTESAAECCRVLRKNV